MSDKPTPALPTHHLALTLRSTTVDPKVESQPLPLVQPGTLLLRILSTPVISYTRDVFLSGNPRQYTYPLPLVPGTSAVGRVAATPTDAPNLLPGQLVLFDCFVRSRDTDATGAPARYLSALHDGYTPASKQLMAVPGWCRDGSFAEYMAAPVESCHVLDERRLLGPPEQGGLGYTAADLGAITAALIPFGGLRSIDLRPGETVLVAPATGAFGGAACLVALAAGARVIAWGRDTAKLARLRDKLEGIAGGRYKGMVDTVGLSADADADLKAIKQIAGPRGLDVFFDISPPAARGSHHVRTGILALKYGGRVSLMGGFREDVPIPHNYVMHFDITIKGKWMYERADVGELIRMVERGVFVLGERGGWDVVGRFGLDRWKDGWDLAAEKAAVGELVVIEP